MWPDVARFLARAVAFVRRMIWKLTDASDQIRRQIDLEKPIDDLIRTTTSDMLDGISEPLRKNQSRKDNTVHRRPSKKSPRQKDAR